MSKYKCLGLILDYKLDFTVTAQSIAHSTNTALGLLIAKAFGGLSSKCFTNFYESMVMPIIRYGQQCAGRSLRSDRSMIHLLLTVHYEIILLLLESILLAVIVTAELHFLLYPATDYTGKLPCELYKIIIVQDMFCMCAFLILCTLFE